MRLGMITLDCLDPVPVAAWWEGILGGSTIDVGESGEFLVLSGAIPGINLGFARVPDPTPGKNLIHLDFDLEAGEERAALLASIVAAGAVHQAHHEYPGMQWDVFQDPFGTVFCIGDAHED
ncbi:VOC family protein [Mycetocola tolaasinivorans]|uniref:VOC family protein n=1 Tax=Mycetocola tolaasinivorans TaxID=76635 RepID=A0A3L7A6S3_9MICO|nr:VOC family protein [Mycetocola tolaasinivorans]RLP76033.1 VOC family protein [Mycetocola tolaasinivorans]